MKRWSIAVSGLVLSSLLFAACGNSPTIIDTRGPVAREEAWLFWMILIIATIIFVGVESVLIFSLVRFRWRPNRPEPRQIQGHNVVEIIWTAIPAVFLLIVLVLTLRTLVTVSQPDSNDQMVVRAFGHQYWWQFDYEGERITTADTLHVPAGKNVVLKLYSDNVIHSFWVPQLSGKTDVIPGHDNKMWFRADAPNATPYEGFCAEFCGDQHANMRFRVKVDSPDEYNTWLIQQKKKSAVPTSDLAKQGAQLFTQRGCTGCHGIVGVNMNSQSDPIAATFLGPDLTHFGSRDLIAGGVLVNDPNGKNLTTWLQGPATVKPGVAMVIVQLSPQDIQALVAYLQSLK